ncbi:DUF1499 domain-containing protein [Microbulbifer yueqingensis]|uniref:DUF1499 domain-containing protein n=1 Tax=Microbulbifer yueqingensis TaxID=658219 RepID=A0A1G9AQE4_9GAMM|nr:DUF1499 domain-containing protein [Microbulbifer yueqingensis]SDK29562.1 Protein of unknown function [Microbulbifer yueqingensis]
MGATHWSGWLVRAQLVLVGTILVAGLALRLDLAHFRPVFQVFKYAGLGMLGVALASMLVFIWGLVKRQPATRTAALWAVVLGLLPVAVPLLTVGRDNFSVPPIHDITTDLENPPRYRAVLALREEGDNSARYDGEQVARQQREADIYEDIRPLELDQSVAEVTAMAAEAAKDLGWRIVARDDRAGHLEAVDRTPLLGFRDDVVVRVTTQDGGSRVDVRSSSRVGVSDLGANAERIRRFLTELEELSLERER